MSATIQELLYQQLFIHSDIALPGLGTFRVRKTGSSIDHVQGTIAPPTTEVIFDASMKVDDGLLVQALSQKLSISTAKATEAIQKYGEEISQLLEQKEMVVFQKIGRLYLDYENQPKFIAETTNFNKETFGLPTVTIQPVQRQKVEPIQHANPQEKTPEKISFRNPDAKPVSKWFLKSLPWIILLSLLIIALSVWLAKRNATATDLPAIADIDQNGNDEMSVDSSAIMTPPPSPEPVPEPVAPVEDTEAPTPVKKGKVGVIIVAALGDENNVNKLTKKIQTKGFDVYTAPAGSLTKVGVQFNYANNEELAAMLEKVQGSLEEKAYILD